MPHAEQPTATANTVEHAAMPCAAASIFHPDRFFRHGHSIMTERESS